MSLRLRLLLIGLVGVGAALAAGSVVLYLVVRWQGTHEIDVSARATGDQVASLVTAGQLPERIPVTGSQLVQVVDSRDRVLSASANADQLTSLLQGGELRRTPLVVEGARAGLDEPLRALAIRTHAPGGARETVVVAQPYGDLLRTVRLLRLTLLITFPLLLAVLGLIAWRVMGMAMRQVEALRRGAERISGNRDDTRLPVPGSRDEIAALASTLNSMLDRLAESRERQRSFVADAAHELRSPLASMRAQLEVAERLGEGGRLAPDLLADLGRIIVLTEDLLALARLDAGGPVTAGVCDLEVVLATIRRRYADARAHVQVPEGTPIMVAADTSEVERVVDNLVANAVRHARSRVRVRVQAQNRWVRLVVEDDGPGIRPADRERVFERFARLDDARDRDAGGAGLGLAIVGELVGRLGGSVRLDDSGWGGLCAEVRLPTRPISPTLPGAPGTTQNGSMTP